MCACICIKKKRIVQSVDGNTSLSSSCLHIYIILKKEGERARDKREKSDDVVGGTSSKE